MLGTAAQGFPQTAWGKHGAGGLGAAPLTSWESGGGYERRWSFPESPPTRAG